VNREIDRGCLKELSQAVVVDGSEDRGSVTKCVGTGYGGKGILVNVNNSHGPSFSYRFGEGID
jgi:hypothetical protein